MMGSIKDKLSDASAQQIIDEVGVATDPGIKKQVISIQGSGQALVIPGLENLTGGGSGGRQKDKKKGDR